MAKAIFMASTRVPAEKTALEIQKVLVTSGARQVASDYGADGKIKGLRFVIEAQGVPLAFSLPVRTEALLKKLRGDRARAEMVAWRQLLRWVQAQMAMIDVGMVKAEEIYAPYMLRQDGSTLWEWMASTHYKALPAAPPVPRLNGGESRP